MKNKGDRWRSKTWYKKNWGIDVTKLNLKPKLIDSPLCRRFRWAPPKFDAWDMDDVEQEIMKGLKNKGELMSFKTKGG